MNGPHAPLFVCVGIPTERRRAKSTTAPRSLPRDKPCPHIHIATVWSKAPAGMAGKFSGTHLERPQSPTSISIEFWAFDPQKNHPDTCPLRQTPRDLPLSRLSPLLHQALTISWADSILTVVVPRTTQSFIPTRSVNEDQLRLGGLRQVWFIPFVDKRVGVQVKLWNPSTTRAIPDRFCSEVPISCVYGTSCYRLPFITLVLSLTYQFWQK